MSGDWTVHAHACGDLAEGSMQKAASHLLETLRKAALRNVLRLVIVRIMDPLAVKELDKHRE